MIKNSVKILHPSNKITIYLIDSGGEFTLTLRVGKFIKGVTVPYLKIRGWFPAIKYVSYWDCDSARYYTGHHFFTWNDKHCKKLTSEFNRYSDGILVRNGTLKGFINERTNKSRV